MMIEPNLFYEKDDIGVEKSADYYQMAKERIDTAELQTSLIKSIMPDGDEED